MSNDGGDPAGGSENMVQNGVEHDENLSGTSPGSDRVLNKENGIKANPNADDTHDQLAQMVVELKFQNEYLQSHFQDFKNLHADSFKSYQQTERVEQNDGSHEETSELREKIESLNKEFLEEKQTRGAAEQALKHLQVLHTEADTKCQELSAKLAEVQQNMDQQLKERDEKYTELDAKLNRLHKRAKQRIQEVQKEKEDLEAQSRDATEKAELASSQVSTLQQELERTRKHANEALKAIDVDRQQLRTANNKLRDDIEELRRSLEPKEHALEALQQSLVEKEQIQAMSSPDSYQQMLEDMQGLLHAAEEKRQTSLAELASKHQKHIESLEAQLADSVSDRNKATDTISSLQRLVAEKESKLADMDAASTGEAARLRAAIETIKGELNHTKHEHDKEKERWELASQALNRKLEIAEGNCIRAEIEAAKMRSQLELELSMQTQLLNSKDTELATAREEANRLENDFAAYKVRAHALLQRKDAELAAAMDNEQLKALEETIKEAENEIMSVSAEKDKALQNLADALSNHNKELSARDATISTLEQQMKAMEIKFSSTLSKHQSEKEAWERNLQNVEETWRLRCEALKAEKSEVSPNDTLQKEVEDLKLRYRKLKEEHESFRDLADKLIEEKDNEISRLLNDNENLHQSLASRPAVDNDKSNNGELTGLQKQEAANSAAEQQILILARQQAQREEELAQTQRHILALQEEIEELEHENRLHSEQEAMLKEELRNMERMQKREGVDLTYLKNVIVKLLETGEVGALLPVVAMLLQFSPEEIRKCQQGFRSSTDVPPSPASDASGSGLSLFSRFSFS